MQQSDHGFHIQSCMICTLAQKAQLRGLRAANAKMGSVEKPAAARRRATLAIVGVLVMETVAEVLPSDVCRDVILIIGSFIRIIGSCRWFD